MGLKAMAEKALQQCAPRTIERTSLELVPAHSPLEIDSVRTLQTTEEADDFWQTLRARIDECDALIHQLCDLRGDDDEHRADLLAVRKRMAPQKLDSDIAYLKAEIAALTPLPSTQTRGRCIECVSFAHMGTGERCAHPDRSPASEPERADCLPANQCERFIHWRAKL